MVRRRLELNKKRERKKQGEDDESSKKMRMEARYMVLAVIVEQSLSPFILNWLCNCIFYQKGEEPVKDVVTL